MVNQPGSADSWFPDSDVTKIARSVPNNPAPEAPPAAGVTVNYENVLGAATVVQDQVDELRSRFLAIKRDLLVEPPGGDEVSQEVAEAWNHRLVGADDSYAARVEQYIQNLDQLANALRQCAKNYGYSETEIAATFGDRSA